MRELAGSDRRDGADRRRAATRSTSGCARRKSSSRTRSFSRRRCASRRRRTTGSSSPASASGVSVVVGNRGAGELGVARVTLLGFDGPGACARRASRPRRAVHAAPRTCSTPADARLTDVYWQRPENAGRATFDADAPFGLPFRPSPFRARVELDIGGTRVIRELPVQYRYEGAGLVGEKRMELNVVPAFAVSVSPQIVVVPRKPRERGRERSRRPRAARDRHQRRARARRRRRSASRRRQGGRCRRRPAAISFTREDESTTTRFTVTPPAQARAGRAARSPPR